MNAPKLKMNAHQLWYEGHLDHVALSMRETLLRCRHEGMSNVEILAEAREQGVTALTLEKYRVYLDLLANADRDEASGGRPAPTASASGAAGERPQEAGRRKGGRRRKEAGSP